MKKKILFIIPARGGSKGLPNKNSKILGEIPLILYSLKFARYFAQDNDICVSTNDQIVSDIVSGHGYKIPFIRPSEIASDTAGMREVLLHALDFYEIHNGKYDYIILLQPTSPFRLHKFIEDALGLADDSVDMVVSVHESKSNPYFNLFEQDNEGFLKLSKSSAVLARQQAPKVFQYNGNFYLINTNSLRRHASIAQFPRIRKYVIPSEYSIDIDSILDWIQAEYLLENKLISVNGEL